MSGTSGAVTDGVQRVLEALGETTVRSAQSLGAAYQAQLAEDRRGRQQAGAFYTPAFLVDFVLDVALRPALESRSDAEIFALRISDPACGSGVFLVAALELIEDVLVARGHRRGNALRSNISACLRGVDIDPIAAELCRIALSDACGAKSRADIECASSLLIEHPPADVVVTNPPWGHKNLRFDEETRAALRARYATAKGVLDPFKLFIELAHEIVVAGGRWAMVLPDIILLKNHEPTRRLILERSSLEWVAHAGQVFEHVNIDACVISAEHRPPAPEHRVRTRTSLASDWREDPSPERSRAQSVFAALPGAKLNIVASDDDLARVETLASLPRVGDLFEIHEGVHSGNRRAALFLHAPKPPSAPLILGGNEISPFQLRWGGRHINLDPAAIDRDGGGYANLGRPEWHTRKKVVVRRTGDHMIAAFDRLGLHVSNNFFVVVPRRPMSDSALRAAVALLGSALMTWYFRTVQPRAGRLFAELKIAHLRDFPMAPLSTGETRSLAAQVRELERPGLTVEQRSALRAVLDQHVDAAYARMRS